jgi:hypothetical protein
VGGVGGRRKEGRDVGGAPVDVAEIEDVVSGATAGCEIVAKRGWGVVVFVFEIRDLWPGEERMSGSSPEVPRRRRLGEDGEKSSFCAAPWTCSRG